MTFKVKLLLISCLSIMSSPVFAQFSHSRAVNHYSDNFWIVEQKLIDPRPIHTAPKLMFNGMDFSQLVVVKTESQIDTVSTANIARWNEIFEKRCVGKDKVLLKKMLGNSLSDCPSSAQNREENNQPYNQDRDTLFKLSDIEHIVASYSDDCSVYPEFVAIAELFDPAIGGAIIDFVFFDPQSKKVLWYCKVQGKANVWNNEGTWGEAVNNAFFRFRKIYAKKKKEWKKTL